MKKINLLLYATIIAGILLRIYNLTAVSLWHDEAFSALLIKYNFREMIDRIILDVHPPFYYIALRFWDIFFGNSLFSIRAFSVFFSVLIILATYLFVKAAFKNSKLALFSSAIVAISPFQIQYAQEARMYALGAFLIVISSYFLLRALDKKKSSRIWWLLYAISVSAAIYTHYYVVFSIFAQALFVLYHFFKKLKFSPTRWLKNKNFQLCLASYLLVTVSYLPWLKTFLAQLGQVQENYWIPKMDFWSVPCTFYKLATGSGINPSDDRQILVISVTVIAITIIYALKKIKTSAKWLVFSMLAVPFAGAIVLSFKTSIYLDRYFIFVSAFFIILICGAILKIKNPLVKNVLIVLTILLSAYSFVYNSKDIEIEKKPGMAGAAAYINQEAKPNDKIYVGSSFVYFTFKYYNETQIYPKLYAPGELSHFSGTALLSSEDIIKNFEQETREDNTVWLINTTGFGNYQPQTPDNWIKESEKSFQDAYGYQGWIIVSKYKTP